MAFGAARGPAAVPEDGRPRQEDGKRPRRHEARGDDRRREAQRVQRPLRILPDRHVGARHAGPRGHRQVPRPHADRGPVPRDEVDARDPADLRQDARAHRGAPHGLLHRADDDAAHPAQDEGGPQPGVRQGTGLDIRPARCTARQRSARVAGDGASGRLLPDAECVGRRHRDVLQGVRN